MPASSASTTTNGLGCSATTTLYMTNSSTYTTGDLSNIWTGWVSNAGVGTLTGYATNNYLTAGNLVNIWQGWVTQVVVDPRQGTNSRIQIVQPTAEEIEAQRAARVKAEAEYEEAKRRAAALLEEHLSEEQRVSWREHNVIDLTSERNKRYRIKRNNQWIANNVFELDESGREVASLCAHPDDVPFEDMILTQLLALSYCEEHFLKVANRRQLVAA